MNYAILSAGEGSRLKNESVNVPKPLVKIAGKHLIERLLSIFWDNNAESIHVITNLESETKIFLEKIQDKTGNKLHTIYKATPSSAHSFYELIPSLLNKQFCLTTVDTIFAPEEFTDYMNEFSVNKSIDGLMAVTSYIDDESPLYVEVDDDMKIIGFHDKDNGNCKYVSGGMYAFKPSVAAVVKKAAQKGITRMRNLQRELIENGLHLEAYPFSKIIDIDHVSDIKKAEKFLAQK